MLTLYVVCLIIGGALVTVSIFAGGDADADVDLDTDLDVDADVDGATGEGVAAAARFLSLRNAVFFAAFFGMTGVLFTLLGIGPVLTPVFAVVVGAIAAASIHALMDYLRSSETAALPGPGTLQGALAEVVVDLDEQHSGKVAVKRGDCTLQLVARVHDEAETRRFRVGDEVVIVALDGGVAQVAGTRFLA